MPNTADNEIVIFLGSMVSLILWVYQCCSVSLELWFELVPDLRRGLDQR